MAQTPITKEQKARLTSNQVFLVANVPTQDNLFWSTIEENSVLNPIQIRDILGTVGSTPSDHTRMLLDALRRGTVGMLDGFFQALKDTGKGYVVDVLHGQAAPDNSPSPSPCGHLNEALGTHKANWKKSILTIPLFDFASRGKTDLSNLYVPLYLVHNKNDQTDLDTAEVRSERVIPTEMIFRDYDGSLAPNTVLIEGMPGSGKTTFTRAYMFDWCSSCSGKTQAPRGVLTWKLILYVPVTKITSSVEDAIKSAIAVEPLMHAEVYNLLVQYPAYCSVIFDGIDECRDENLRKQLSKYIEESKMGQKPKVIVTARTYLCGLDAGLFQRHLRCDGFTEVQAITYIDQFFVEDKNKATEIKQKVSITDQSLTNPLRLYMACLGIQKGLIDISSCDRLSSTKLFLSQEQLLLQREQKKLGTTRTAEQLDEEFRKFTILTLQTMLQGKRSLSPKMLKQAGIHDNSVVKVFLNKDYRFTLSGEEECWTYRHETLYEFLSARGLGFLPPDSKLCVLLYICAQKEFRNLMVLFIGILGHSPDDTESAEDKDSNENLIEDMLKVCLILQGRLDKQGIPPPERAKVKSTKDNIAALVKDQSLQLLIRTLCSPNATELSVTQTELKNTLCRNWTLAVDTFYDAVMREPSQVFFGMMEEERDCGIITHLTACIQECQKANLNIIHWVIPGHWRNLDGHGSLLEKDVYQVGDGRWVMVSYSIWQYGKARVFDAWSPDDAVYAWKQLQESSREKQQEDDVETTLRNQAGNRDEHQVHETTSRSHTASSSFQSLEFRLPSPRESFRVWGTNGQAPQHCFSTEAWRRFFDAVIADTREFHLYLAVETPLVPLLEAVLMKLDDLRTAVKHEMEIWGGHITLQELTCWLEQYKARAPFACLQLKGIDVVSEDTVKDVLQRFETETVIDADTLYCKRPVNLT